MSVFVYKFNYVSKTFLNILKLIAYRIVGVVTVITYTQ